MKKTPDFIDDGLPQEPTKQVTNMSSLRWLIVAPPGWGKTTLFSAFPDSIMLACEEGHKFTEGYKVIIDEWDSKDYTPRIDSDGNNHMAFMQALQLLENSPRFNFVYLDTIDALVKKCTDYYLNKANAEHISELGDYGKGYDLGQNKPIRLALERLFATGRGVGLTTHQEIKTNSFKKGPVCKKETTLPAGIAKLVLPQMDIVIHGEFGSKREGLPHRDRIAYTEGSEDILTKNRGGVMPAAWIVPSEPRLAAKQIEGFFLEPTSIESAKAEFQTYYEE